MNTKQNFSQYPVFEPEHLAHNISMEYCQIICIAVSWVIRADENKVVNVPLIQKE
jgi:hypothetical protein